MKILIVSHEYPPIGGGGANACMHLANEYALSGNQVIIVTTWFEGLLEKETIPGRAGGEVTIYRLKAKRKHKEHCGFPEMADYLIKALTFSDKLHKKENFDICQIFFAIPSGPVGYVLKKKYKLPYIIRFGGGDIPGFQERFGFIYKLIGPFEKILLRSASALVVNSEGLKRMLLNFYKKKEVTIITNGADVVDHENLRVCDTSCVEDKLKEASIGIVDSDNIYIDTDKNKCINILFVSRLIQRKGLQDVLPNLAKLDINWKLTIAGDGPYRQTLEEQVRELKLEKHVDFLGQKNKSELPEVYSSGDVFILPSHKEGMPNVVLEAMSYGLPIIMTRCEGSEELIDGNGYAVDANEFGDKITKLYQDEALRKQMGNRSLELIDTRFRWENVAGRYIELMKSVINNT